MTSAVLRSLIPIDCVPPVLLSNSKKGNYSGAPLTSWQTLPPPPGSWCPLSFVRTSLATHQRRPLSAVQRYQQSSMSAINPKTSQTSQTTPQSVLVADIGGTNCRFQLWELDTFQRPARLAVEHVYETAGYEHFDLALEAFLRTKEGTNCPPKAAAFACAGPVRQQRCTFTNLGWVIDAVEVTQKFGFPCCVLNDFEAVGYGVTVLSNHDVLVLNDVPTEPKGPKAVLGPGTGLGEAQLFWDDALKNYRVHASEGAHATFAPRGWKQRALQAHVEAERGHCSVERVACGSGLVRIYNFLHSDEISNRLGAPPQLQNPTPADISTAALAGSDPVAAEALDMLLAIVGAEASHMALRCLATGGVYIAGGVFPKVIDRVKAGGVLEAFLWKASRFHDKVLKDIPLYVVLEERVGLMGSREKAIQLVQMEMLGAS